MFKSMRAASEVDAPNAIGFVIDQAANKVVISFEVVDPMCAGACVVSA
jgi:hypothetical protein